jgi:phosphotransferase system HPr-like phosphotransfer protein
MKLKAGPGLPLHIRAAGEDARAAVDALVALVHRDFHD